MRIAYFLLPITNPRGEQYDEAHQHARHLLLKRFNGYTASHVEGAWINNAGTVVYDRSIRYDVAIDATGAGHAVLWDIAAECGRMARQECVFFCGAGGDVSFIPTLG